MVNFSALSSMDKKIRAYLLKRWEETNDATQPVDACSDSPVWQMHLNRARNVLEIEHEPENAKLLAEIMTQKEENLLDALWLEGYRQSDYVRIEDGVKIGRTDTPEIETLKLPRKEDVDMPYFVAYKNGVFLLGDVVNRHYVLTEDVQMVDAMLEHGYVYQKNINVPLSDTQTFFMNPLKDYKWRRHHKNAMEATMKHRAAVLRMSLASPSLPSEEDAEYSLFRAERRKNRLRTQDKFHIYAMPQDSKDELKQGVKILAGIAASLMVSTSITTHIVSCCEKEQTPPKIERVEATQKSTPPAIRNQNGR